MMNTIKKEKTLVQTHPQLIKWLGSKNPLWVFISLQPLLLFFIYWLNFDQITLTITLFFAGVLYWSFLEYAIHRWLYHITLRVGTLRNILDTFHLYHHRNLTDRRVLNAGPLLVYPMSVMILLPFYYLLAGDLSLLSAFALGTLSFYGFYEWVHFMIHYKHHTRGYLRLIQRYHMYHHEKRWHKNYGNTSILWDLVFQSYDNNWRSYELSNASLDSLILSSKIPPPQL
jgi:4-hydroxysphinganine ceramide fatty acyl 2-hydroxylase